MKRETVSIVVLAAGLSLLAGPALAQASTMGQPMAPPHQAASNITSSDTQSTIAPPLPVPVNLGDNAPPAQYLQAAQSDLSSHRTGAAQQALEMAETRLLDRTVPATQGDQPDSDPAISHISNALMDLSQSNISAAQQETSSALSSLSE